MNAALFRKELRDLLPWGVLGLALALSNVAEILLEQELRDTAEPEREPENPPRQ